jgi:hypothetical protein
MMGGHDDERNRTQENTMGAIDSRARDALAPSVVRALIRRIVDGVAVGQKYP